MAGDGTPLLEIIKISRDKVPSWVKFRYLQPVTPRIRSHYHFRIWKSNLETVLKSTVSTWQLSFGVHHEFSNLDQIPNFSKPRLESYD